MQQAKPLFTQPVAIAATMAAGLMVTGAGALPAAGGRVLGCLKEACTVAGQILPVDCLGSVPATAAAAFAVDTLLMVDATGKVLTWTTGNVAIGRALEAAGAAGDRPEVLLIPN